MRKCKFNRQEGWKRFIAYSDIEVGIYFILLYLIILIFFLLKGR